MNCACCLYFTAGSDSANNLGPNSDNVTSVTTHVYKTAAQNMTGNDTEYTGQQDIS